MTQQTQPATSNTQLPDLKDLSTDTPRDPREMLAGFMVVPRIIDKCRAVVAGTNDEYHYNCGLDKKFFEFSGIRADAFQEFVATGATDAEIETWLSARTGHITDADKEKWNQGFLERGAFTHLDEDEGRA